MTPTEPVPPTPITNTQRLLDLAAVEPDVTAIVFVAPDGTERAFTNAELLPATLRMARLLARHGVDERTLVAVVLGNTSSEVIVILAAWWLGACVVPVSDHLPERELDDVLDAGAESGRVLLVVGDVSSSRAPVLTRAALFDANSLPADPLPVRVPHPGRAIPSGGSTGRPKLISDEQPMLGLPEAPSRVGELFGRRPRQRVLVLGPLHHTGPFGSVFGSLFDGGRVVLMERFDAELALRLVERHHIERIWSVPVQLLRMAQVDWIDQADLSSVETLYHSGAVCPPWLKRRWIELVGPEHVFEGFGSTEAVGSLMIRGDEWLEHPGSVGRPEVADVSIRDDVGRDVRAGEIGEIFMRWRLDGEELPRPSYRYWGSPPAKSDDEGYVSVGDLGWRDEDGYVYVADRRVDMIITGGVNVFPAEVEAVLTERPEVRDVAVVGIPDVEWGKRVHAIIETDSHSPDLVAELDRHCRSRMAPPKVPKSYEFVPLLPRNDAGKIRRNALVTERATGDEAGMLRPPRSVP